jgi:type I restriction enzyme S subunit
MLRITDIQDGAVNWDAVPNCGIANKDLPRFRLRSGDLVFARTGATVGKSFLIDEAPEAVFASYLIRLSFDGTVVPGYMALFFQSPEYWRQVASGSLGVGQPNVNATTLGRITMALPTIAEQKQALLAMTELDHELSRPSLTVNAQLRRAQSMKSSILTAAFNGQLIAEGSSTEPSSLFHTNTEFILRS